MRFNLRKKERVNRGLKLTFEHDSGIYYICRIYWNDDVIKTLFVKEEEISKIQESYAYIFHFNDNENYVECFLNDLKE